MLVRTLTVQIDNSDNKLPQDRWVQFIDQLCRSVDETVEQVHFAGHSNPTSQFQNFAVVFNLSDKFAIDKGFGDVDEMIEDHIMPGIALLAKLWGQESIAVTVGETVLVEAQV